MPAAMTGVLPEELEAVWPLVAGLAAIEAWAREQGCDAVEPFCRPGWKRELRALGYRERHVLMRKALRASTGSA